MQSAKDVARAKEAEAAFHARLNEAQHEMETEPNPYKRYKAAHIIGQLTCNSVRPPSFPDDHLWLGALTMEHERALDKYFNRCRRLWREQVVNAQT